MSAGRTAPFACDPADVHVGEGAARFADAAARFVGTEILADGPEFDEAYGAMHAYFGPKNEIERRPILVRWLREPEDTGRVVLRYHLLAWHDRDGALAGVRDAFVGVDRERRCCVVLLSHSFVMPDHRRSGVAALIRTSVATLARRGLAREGLDPRGTPTVLVAEMEPVVPADVASIVRQLTYGRSGFRVIPPEVLPYCQPDFRDLEALGVPAEPIPMPCVVRWLDHEDEVTLPTLLADALVEQLALIHLRACEPSHVVALAASDRAGLAGRGERVPLVVLPTRPSELDRLEPLLRSRALRHYPARFRVGVPDPDEDLAALREVATNLEQSR